MTSVSSFLYACRADLGYSESPSGSNCNKFASCAGHKNCEPWCATFLVCKAKRTGLHLPNYSAYTPTLAQGFKDMGRYGRTPRVGAFGFVYHPELGRVAHVFVVEKVLSDGYTIGINGNSNDGGSRTGGKVCRVTRSPLHITYGYPVYSTVSTTPTTAANPWRTPVLTDSRPYISRTSSKTKAEVQWVQWACMGPNHDDGVWGDMTEKYVRLFQSKHGLGVDGRVGPNTLSKMKAVRR